MGRRERIRRRWFGPSRRLAKRAVALHRDETGGALEYVLVLGVFCVPIIMLLLKLLEVLADYFGMIAFYVSWPFL